ncbi:MAG: hypothetical protein IJP42_10205, partial [Selenomonadaceae bacterium]|nr:hypothetical protein [Selenomonadaceae bacterium]
AATSLVMTSEEFMPEMLIGKNHSTVKDACELAETLHVKNLLLYHTEDKNLSVRKKLYCAEGQEYFSGKIHVPDDLETLAL